VKGNVQLTAGEVRKIRLHLLTSNPSPQSWLENLKFFTMILTGISLFLRSEELLTIKMNRFVSDMTMIRDIYRVRAIVLSIKGKSDLFPLYMVLGANDEHPYLCPVQHLLV
jgi:hypothetical protein